MEQKITVGGQMTGNINFAMQQNCVPVFRSLILTNQTEEPIEQVTLQLTFEPAFANPFTMPVPQLPPHTPVEISPVRITLLSDFLYSLTERMTGSVHIAVMQGDACLYAEDRPLALLAYDEWPGTLIMPELIAAFVTPNHPKVTELVAKASLFLQKWLGTPTFDGYQSKNPNIVKHQAAAIYAALQAENLAYRMPPASYEVIGQRVRLPDAVLEQKCGTCLDLSVLYAACLEAVGLYPILVFLQGHAFAGCWLTEETFAECVEDDVSALTKRTAAGIDQLCLVECTDYVAGKQVDFDHAGKHGVDALEKLAEFVFAVDIRRCRGSGIRPIPTRILENGVYATVDYGVREADEITNAPKAIDLSLHGAVSGQQAVTRKTLWERKLLDLSLRNSLLNFRPTASNVQFMTADLGHLEDEISRGEDFKIMPVPNDFVSTLSDSKIYEIETEKDLITTIAETECRSHRLRTFLAAPELEKTLKKLHRQAKISLEENGANTLYLAIGFLRWYETEQSDRARYAPLVLVPVDILKKIQDRSYSIRIRDEEVQMNITLLEMLRQDFGLEIQGLQPLPCDESGINLPLIFNTMRQGILSKKHWDIEAFAFLGQFSFNQFIMWNDIRSRSADLEKNKVVASLISAKLEWTPEALAPDPHGLDAQVPPCDMAVPVSADSSQLAAIYEAARGQSFVLHGPPGTGKSQTITNMIANALYNGKSVLFVAEKMAALSVVQKRLAAIGLGPFCLELHSNKAQKKAVLGQLENTLAVGHVKAPASYTAEAERLHRLRSELNATMEALYEKRCVGLSVYDAITMLETDHAEGITFTTAQVDGADAARYTAWTDLVRKTAVAGNALGGFRQSTLQNYCGTQYTPEIRDSFLACAKALSACIGDAEASYTALAQTLGQTFSCSFAGYAKSMQFLITLYHTSHCLPAALSDPGFAGKQQALEALLAAGVQRNALYAELSNAFAPTVWTFDCDGAMLTWKQTQQKWFLPKLLGSKKLVQALAAHGKQPGLVTKENILGFYEKLSAYKQLQTQLTGADPRLTTCFGAYWTGENSDFALLQDALAGTVALREALAACGTEADVLRQAALAACGDGMSEKRGATEFAAANGQYETLCKLLAQAKQTFGIRTEAVTAGDSWFAPAQAEADGWAASGDSLKARVLLENDLEELRGCGLAHVADAYTTGVVTESNLLSAFRTGVCKAVISSAFQKVPALAEFQGAQFEDTIAKYRETAAQFEALTIQELVARLSAKIPDSTAGAAGSSEIAVLQKAIRSGGRMLPIRKLFDSIPNLLRRICPCMLMSPISVAQYIDPNFPKFDLVIFDEASQMPTCEAVGAIARGENVVVVGDPKQLPPTSFFAANQVDEAHYEQEDLESVLDDCLALAMPQRHLLWHYRSRHESLIAFSNAKFYENRLFTFPSPEDLVSEVTWIHVDGYYDKGGSKQNHAEAEAIVGEIVRRLSDEALRRESIGVVTFSMVQQILIDDLLAEEFCKNPQLEQYANEMYEPILVKNLENVQGDERDVILFSIGYGPDKDGKVSMNFGPLNRDGGWRRLNVAISRARKGMQVYSVITPEQIDLSRTRSDGVAALRGFLEFAAKGRSALAVRAQETTESGDFIQCVADAVQSLGYAVQCNVGSSAYKIDIGVVNPEQPERFVLGILCENEHLFEATTARDRNILQPKVLDGLGWEIYSVHILDWYENRQKSLEGIRFAIEAAIAQSKTEPEPLPQAAPVRAPLEFETEEIPSVAEQCSAYSPYKAVSLGTPEQFYEAAALPKIQKLIRDVIAAQAPVCRKTVLGYVLNAYGIARSGSRVEATFDAAVSGLSIRQTVSNDIVFFWKAEQDPVTYSDCRISKDGTEKRPMDEICAEEICNGMLLILKEQISMQKADIYRETAKLFGFSRSGGTVEAAVNQGLRYAFENGKAYCENDRIMRREE